MKKYTSLGELLGDYRKLKNISQTDLAGMLDVDVRTIRRWENNASMITPEKEIDVLAQTFIPYQVIRNLNAAVPLPIHYNFLLRKYSFTELSIGLPNVDSYKAHLELISPSVHKIKDDSDSHIDEIIKYQTNLLKTHKPISKELIIEAAKLLPELNLILYDNAGFYAGHCVVLPIAKTIHNKLKNRTLKESAIKPTDLVNYKTNDSTVFFAYSVYADCNENSYFMLSSLLNFINDHWLSKYLFSALVVRSDGIRLATDFGLRVVWVDETDRLPEGLDASPTFFEGRLSGITSSASSSE